MSRASPRAPTAAPRRFRVQARHLVWTALLAAAGCFLIFGIPGLGVSPLLDWYIRADERLASQLTQRLDVADEDEIEPTMHRLARLGAPGLKALVRLSVSPRAPIATAARAELLAAMEGWNGQALPTAASQIALVAETLAEESESLEPRHQPFARHVAENLLEWPLSLATTQHATLSLDVIGHCERVLQATSEVETAWESGFPLPLVASLEDAPVNRLAQSLRALESNRNSDPTPANEATAAPTPELSIPPAEFSVPPGIASPLLSPPPQLSSVPEERPIEVIPRTVSEPLQLPPSSPPASAGETLPLPFAPLAPDELRGLEDWSVMQRLNAPDAAIALPAADELLRRGFRRQDLTLAEEMTSPDPERRAKAATELSDLPGVQFRPWLVQLSRDPDPRVRRAAVSVMATTSDPMIHRRLREMEITESDSLTLRALKQARSAQSLLR